MKRIELQLVSETRSRIPIFIASVDQDQVIPQIITSVDQT